MLSVLIIEDDSSLQNILTLAFTKAGYKVYSELNGKDGLAEIRRIRPDVVLLDLMLPMMPGVDVLKSLKEDKEACNIPVIVMTAYGDPEGILERFVLKLGAREYKEKPFVVQEMLSLVRITVRRYQKDGDPFSESDNPVIQRTLQPPEEPPTRK